MMGFDFGCWGCDVVVVYDPLRLAALAASPFC